MLGGGQPALRRRPAADLTEFDTSFLGPEASAGAFEDVEGTLERFARGQLLPLAPLQLAEREQRPSKLERGGRGRYFHDAQRALEVRECAGVISLCGGHHAV